MESRDREEVLKLAKAIVRICSDENIESEEREAVFHETKLPGQGASLSSGQVEERACLNRAEEGR